MSEYRFVSFVPVVGEKLPYDVLARSKDRNANDYFVSPIRRKCTQYEFDNCEFIRPVDNESPAEPVTATIQATPAMTVREQFAMEAMVNLIHTGVTFCSVPPLAVTFADALIAELAKPKVSE